MLLMNWPPNKGNLIFFTILDLTKIINAIYLFDWFCQLLLNIECRVQCTYTISQRFSNCAQRILRFCHIAIVIYGHIWIELKKNDIWLIVFILPIITAYFVLISKTMLDESWLKNILLLSFIITYIIKKQINELCMFYENSKF